MNRLLFLSLSALSVAAQYSATYLPYNAPTTWQNGQTGTNKCGTESSQTSMCQNLYLNAVDDFCLFAPPNPNMGPVGETEQLEVAWCLRSGYGTRLIPDGTIQGVHFVQTPDYVQITGTGDLTKLNIPAADTGGELDPHGADGNGNPIGGLVFGTSFDGTLRQYHEWTNFMSSTEFCFRACIDGPNAAAYCEHIYDIMGCDWNMPGDYTAGSFTSCEGSNSTEPMGVYGTSTFHQGDAVTPAAHPAAPSSNCKTITTVKNQAATTPSASLFPSSVSASLSSASRLSTSLYGVPTTSTTPHPVSASTIPSATGSANSAAGSVGRLAMQSEEMMWAIAATTIGALLGAGALVL
ncbi:hypothetical protein BOTBODRAFT_48091 [Botryobasidium botryosum FD-172 SS1]|uniref:Carbohydrate-binding module family 13 protein n=1 Tax=Botryobasidium botryosum (strain FD-172 SS1) TaxID=930990 RepID=A0A067M9Q5_BOTB1|nr:hypothetical protein BOTBODRAFT_48091 [Botryobasidium botryosum FD-172 SS1]